MSELRDECMKKVVVIGSSTGGPDALKVLVEQLPADFPAPIIVAQHLLPAFSEIFAEQLQSVSALTVSVAKQNECIEPAHVYIIPSDSHFFLSANGPCITLLPTQDLPKPSVDMGFTSVAEHFGPGTIGVILTGMGNDGVVGSKAVKQLGGKIIVQDGETSSLFGMPKRVIESGYYDEIVPLTKIAGRLIELVENYERVS